MIIKWLINTASKSDKKCLSVADETITPVFISDWIIGQISRQLAKNSGDRGWRVWMRLMRWRGWIRWMGWRVWMRWMVWKGGNGIAEFKIEGSQGEKGNKAIQLMDAGRTSWAIWQEEQYFSKKLVYHTEGKWWPSRRCLRDRRRRQMFPSPTRATTWNKMNNRGRKRMLKKMSRPVSEWVENGKAGSQD